MNHKLLITLLYTLTAMAAWGSTADSEAVPKSEGTYCIFTDGVRYSELVINTRLNDFKANRTAARLGVFNAAGHLKFAPAGTKNNLDYVPGLVAKTVIEAVDYYKDPDFMDVRPWFYAVQHYGNRLDISSNGKEGKSFDDLNAVKLYFKLYGLASARSSPMANCKPTTRQQRLRKLVSRRPWKV